MKIYLSENLRAYRIKSGLSQSQIAELTGMSPQAVSRWECGTAYPDITLLPTLANFYGVTLDELCGMDKIKQSVSLCDVFMRSLSLKDEGKYKEAADTIRAAMEVYPNNFALMSVLSQIIALDEAADINEAVCLSEHVLEGSDNAKLKSTTAANLCMLYLRSGENEKAADLAAKMPHIWECREVLYAELADDSEYRQALLDAVKKLLVLAFEKIKGANTRKFGSDPMISGGIDFRVPRDSNEMLVCIAEFLNK